jgi:hypothetical protein
MKQADNDPVNLSDPSGLDPINVGSVGGVQITASLGPIVAPTVSCVPTGGSLMYWCPGGISINLSMIQQPIITIPPRPNIPNVPLTPVVPYVDFGSGFDVPLNQAIMNTIQTSLDALLTFLSEGSPSENCRNNVINRLGSLPGFDFAGFVDYLSRGITAYDGSLSTTPTLSNNGNAAIASWQFTGGIAPPSRVSSLFSDNPGVTALTSGNQSTNNLTVYFNSGAVSGNTQNRNTSLVFHEALHGYGSYINGGTTFGGLSDRALLSLFGFDPDRTSSVEITNHIMNNCF